MAQNFSIIVGLSKILIAMIELDVNLRYKDRTSPPRLQCVVIIGAI